MYHTSVVFQATRLLGISVLHLSGLPAVSIKSGRGATSNVEIWYPHGLEKESSPGLLAGSSFTDSHMSKMSLAQKNSRQIQFLKDSKNNHSTQLLLWTSILNNKELRRKRMHSSTHRSRWPAGKKQLLKPFGSNDIYEDQQGNVFGCTSIPQSWNTEMKARSISVFCTSSCSQNTFPETQESRLYHFHRNRLRWSCPAK